MEAAARVESRSRGAKPQRTRSAQIPPSSRRAKKTTFSPVRPGLKLGVVCRAQIPSRRLGVDFDSKNQISSRRVLNDDSTKKQLRAVYRAHIPSRRGLDDSQKKQLHTVSRAQISSWRGCLLDDPSWQGHPSWWYHPVGARARTKRRRRCAPLPDDNKNKWRGKLANPDGDDGCFSGLIDLPCPPDNNNWRDWANLADGPAGLIAERVLAYDVADFVRFRAVCRPWRQCSSEPRTHTGLDRRFHPWRWVMLQEKLAAPDRRCFLNTSTGECVNVDIPELHDHKLLALTPEGLLVLVHDRKYIRLLNPLTRHLTELPPLTTLVPPKDHNSLLGRTSYFNMYFPACGSGIADDDSTFVLCFNKLSMLGMAKPGDDNWRMIRYDKGTMPSSPVMIAGCFYCITHNAVKMLKIDPDMAPQLKVAAKLKNMHVTPMADTMHLVNNSGEPMLVHRHCGPLTADNKSGLAYDMYRVDLGTKTLVPVKSLGGAGRALFMGMHCSLSVSLEVFPSASISADTIYLSFDFPERDQLDVGAYHLADGSVQVPCSLRQPHTLAECLSLSNTFY